MGNSSGKLSVVDKEIKRIEQQEDDLAKEEENLRVSSFPCTVVLNERERGVFKE